MFSYEEMVDKFIPKKVIVHKSSPDDIILCPSCGSTFVTMEKWSYKVYFKHCPNCAQALNWSDYGTDGTI